MKRRTSAVMVARTPQIDRTKDMASYQCSACDNTTVVQASMEAPHCVHCGNGALTASEQASIKGRTLVRAGDAELANVKCPGCSHHLIMTLATASDHGDADGVGHLNCPACSTEIAFSAPAQASAEDDSWDAPTDTPAEDAPADDLIIDEAAPDAEVDPDAPAEEEAAVDAPRGRRQRAVVASEESDEDKAAEEEAPADEVDPDAPAAEDEDKEEAAAAADAAPAADPVVEAPADPALASEDFADKLAESDDDDLVDPIVDEEAPAAEEEEASAAPVIGTEPTTLVLHKVCTEQASFADVGDTVQCKQGDVITAVRACSEGENPAALARALNQAVQTNELAALLAQNDFNCFSVVASVETVQAEDVSQREAEMASVIEQDRSNMGAILNQSLGIVLCGLDRGFFKNAENPLFKAIATALEEEGLDPEKVDEILTEAVNEAGEEFAGVVRDLTMQTVGKSADVRNELASTVADVRCVKAVASVPASGPKKLSQRLVTPLRPSTAQAQKATASADTPRTSRIAELASRTGGLIQPLT